jgi:hypothetical protein
LTGTPEETSQVEYECLKSWLCRRRHKHDYADPFVMPTSARSALRRKGLRLFGSV